MQLRTAAVAPVEAIIDGAHEEGSLRADVTFADISLLIIRLSHPLPGAFSRELDDGLAHRHLNLVIDGLRGTGGTSTLDGPALSLDDLRTFGPEDPASGAAPNGHEER